MNKECFACGNNKWEYFCDSFDYSGNEMETYKCTNCGHLETIKKIDKEDK